MNENTPDSEKLRLAALHEFQILDTLPEQEFNDITLLASQICETPIAAISLIDEHRQWFKSHVGIDADETPRRDAFCDYTIRDDGLFVVTDTAQDERFLANPLVTGEPHIRFYAGAPLISSDGYRLGALCVIDRKPRQISEAQQRALGALARSVMSLIEARVTKNSASPSDAEHAKTGLIKGEEKEWREDSIFGRYFKPYLIATIVVGAFTLLKIFFGASLQISSPFFLFAFAIMLSAWRGGLGAGLYATLVTVLIVDYLFIPPFGTFFSGKSGSAVSFLIFTAQGIFISLLCASRLSSERLLRHAGKELENRVVRRTQQLAQANLELKQEIEERNVLQEDLRRTRDSAVESARLKSEFLANMSHEIRTPMNGVIGMTGLLLDTKLDDEQKRFAQTIRSSGESLLTIINDILDFSKVEAGRLELETLDFDLRETIESLIEMFSARAREQKNELAALIYSDVPLALRGDAGRIRQILTNLIGNAIKFTKYGDVMIRVEKLNETKDRVGLKISVSDTGEGISEDLQARLFQPFTQSDASTTRRYGGTGLGLSISKKLVEIMNGEIGVETKIGRGSTFWFSLNLEKQESVVLPDNERRDFQIHPELTGKRVLVVDDNDVNREVLSYQTRSWQMKSFDASNGVTALDLLKDSGNSFDLVILDLQMPIMDGLETAQKIAAAGVSPPPIVMISSSNFKASEEKMYELGIRAFLNKPYRQSDLLNAICAALGIAHAEDSEDANIHITATAESLSLPPVGDKSKRILIAEDNSVNQLVAQNLLKKFGYHADVAANGREALQALEIIPYDLVLMDCQMPEMDGYEATRRIRARESKTRRVPIIALTAHATAGEREKCLNAGMDDYISKPIERETLRRTLANWLTNEKTVKEIPAESLFEKASENLSAEPVDFATLDDITSGNEQMQREIVEIYLTQTAESLHEIEDAIATGDNEKLFMTAHKSVGGSALCGMIAIVEPMRTLEKLGKENRAAEAAPFLAEAQRAFAAIEHMCLEKILKRTEILCEK